MRKQNHNYISKLYLFPIIMFFSKNQIIDARYFVAKLKENKIENEK